VPDGTFLTPSQNPLDAGQGKPGQDLHWLGEFVFGYPGQDGTKDVDVPEVDPLKSKTRGAPEFARNGSLLVFRRLRQNVGLAIKLPPVEADGLRRAVMPLACVAATGILTERSNHIVMEISVADRAGG
jgi:hypothetical protein